jgi:phosphate transport system substrate-binding protein
MKLKAIITFGALILCFFVSDGCKQKETKKFENYVTMGEAEIWCDESLKKVIDQEEDVFENNYKYANLNLKYASEHEILKAFYKDSLKAIIVSSNIDSNDIKKFNSTKVFPVQYKFATSAIAFIASPESKLDSIKKEALIENFKIPNSKQRFVIENTKSGIASNILRSIGMDKFHGNVFAKSSKREIIDWLRQNPEDIGLVDWSELSDSDDAEAKKMLSEVKLIAISNGKTDPKYYKPFQYNLNGDYPFTRELYLIRRNGSTDVSLGFASFICGEIGQKILLKAGLLPNYQTERWIEFKGLRDIKVIK